MTVQLKTCNFGLRSFILCFAGVPFLQPFWCFMYFSLYGCPELEMGVLLACLRSSLSSCCLSWSHVLWRARMTRGIPLPSPLLSSGKGQVKSYYSWNCSPYGSLLRTAAALFCLLPMTVVTCSFWCSPLEALCLLWCVVGDNSKWIQY